MTDVRQARGVCTSEVCYVYNKGLNKALAFAMLCHAIYEIYQWDEINYVDDVKDCV